MWYNNAMNVKYWQLGDNKCHFKLREFAGIIINSLISDTYNNISLAQKLQYFLSPIKNTYW